VGGRAFDVNEAGAQSPQLSAAAGGIVQNFSMARGPSFSLNSEYNFDGPYFTNNSMLFNNQMINNINQNLDNSAWLQVISQMILPIINTSNLEARIAALETWRSSGINGCPASNMFKFVSNVTLDTANNRLRFERQSVTFVGGLLTADNCSYDNVDITTTECPA
jgi:hypothetical protein